MSRPLILITNDDGIHAKGLFHLIHCAKEFGDVYVVAPDTPQSGKSSAITVEAPLRITAHPDIDTAKVYSVSGTPVDCVKLALHAITPRKPDMLLSGINHGSNSGVSVIYSGTMGAVMEGCIVGIPSIGFSLLHHSLTADFSLSDSFVKDIIAKALQHPLPEGICLNVNIPALVVPEGVRACRAAKGYWTEEYREYFTPSDSPFYWLTGRFVNTEPQATDTDEYWLDRKYISVVPVAPYLNANDRVTEIANIYDE
ncbi:MAG: 5'/3'-nucleotidase SurE [Muribaculaceae bacterium]|nr:5'/3'-nucleotidase SurE [Muribaculaceae bacterium]